MAKAARSNRLHREQPFVLGLSANRLNTDFPEDETVLIQGIIDVYLEEEDGIVLADYKTDLVKDPKELILRYRVQLDYYEEALVRLTGKMREGKADLFLRAGTGDYTVRWKNFYYHKMVRHKQAVYHGMLQGVRQLADQIQLPRVDGKKSCMTFFSRCGWIIRKSSGWSGFHGNITPTPRT